MSIDPIPTIVKNLCEELSVLEQKQRVNKEKLFKVTSELHERAQSNLQAKLLNFNIKYNDGKIAGIKKSIATIIDVNMANHLFREQFN
jgi:hypothetical protein